MNLHVFYGSDLSFTKTVGFMIFIKSSQATGKQAYVEPATIGLIFTCIITPLMIVLRRLSKRFERY